MKSPVCVIGIDGGATNTVCRVMDTKGDLLGGGKSGPGNVLTADADVVYDSLYQALAQAIKSLETIDIGSICLGMAGSDNKQSREMLSGLLRKLTRDSRLCVKWLLSPETGIIVPDYEIALAGASPDGVGIVTIAGTGSVVFGRNRTGQTMRVGGWGRLIGDEGSAHNIAMQAIKAVFRSYDSREKLFPLTDQLLRHFNVKSVPEIAALLNYGRITARTVASFALLVDEAAAGGDMNAYAIIEDAAEKLARPTRVIIDRLFADEHTINVYTSGSVWAGASGIRNIFQNRLSIMQKTVNVEYPVNEPAYGACLLALKAYIRSENLEKV